VTKFAIGTTPPTIVLTGQTVGPPATATVALQDLNTGLLYTVVASSNCTYSIPLFTIGTNSPVSVTFTKVNQSQKATFTIQATDLAGNSTIFDPVIAALETPQGHTSVTRGFTIHEAEHVLTLQNEAPGLKSVTVLVNGSRAGRYNLSGGSAASVELKQWLHSGSNTVTITGDGIDGSAASVVMAPNALPGANARNAHGNVSEWGT
jgi:hypothetical protein